MKKIFIIISIAFVTSVFGQETFNSSVTTDFSLKTEVRIKKRTITISDTEIKITNYIGGTKTLNLIVNNIKEKEDWLGIIKKWYYCTDSTKDAISGKYTEFIIIIEKSNPKDMEVCQKVDEVTFIKHSMSLR